MLLEQPYKSDTIVSINESELTFLVNRYIIDTYSNLIKNKKVDKKEIKVGNEVVNVVELFGLSQIESDIPDLAFPYYSKENNWIVVDLRKNYSYDKKLEVLQERRTTDINFALNRSYLTGIWVAGGERELQRMVLPHAAFSSWLSNLIANRFGLDLVTKAKVGALALIYYHRLFDRVMVNSNDELEILLVRSRHANINEELLRLVFSQSLDMQSLESFCDYLFEVTDSARLKNINTGILLAITQTGWIGIDNKFNVGVALEFPPIWTAMCHSSLVNNLYQRTSIGDQVSTLGKRGKGDEFMSAYKTLLDNHLIVEKR